MSTDRVQIKLWLSPDLVKGLTEQATRPRPEAPWFGNKVSRNRLCEVVLARFLAEARAEPSQ